MLLPIDNEYIVIGDVHGCIDELKALLIQNGFKINEGIIDASLNNKAIILLGDFIDKATPQKLKDTIEFIYQNYYHLNQKEQRFYILRGNHEEMVYRYISKDPTLEITPKRLEEKKRYYNTASLLEKDSDLRDKFLDLYQNLSIWLKYDYSSDFSVTLTHAPCQERYLAKDDTISHAKMVKSESRSKNRGVKLDDLIPYIHQEAKDNQHYHIFGHLSQPDIRKYKNKICIDTSAIYGNSLSCAIIQKDKLSFNSVPFLNKQKSVTQKYNILFDF
ncbi:MAG: hypothetical protein GXO60_00475 [Epsilonproteobacteria bacterium]|nr:hypothetical protein [Campylobacterota bacterium]